LPEDTGAFLVVFAVRTLALVQDRLELLDADDVPFRGVRCLLTPGHTPGHLAVALSSGHERCLVLGDLFLHPVHIAHPEWYSVVDADPLVLTKTRDAVLGEAAEGGCLVHAFHLPFPAVGRVRRTRKGRAWDHV